MKAKAVNESMNFKRGMSSVKSLELGYESLIKSNHEWLSEYIKDLSIKYNFAMLNSLSKDLKKSIAVEILVEKKSIKILYMNFIEYRKEIKADSYISDTDIWDTWTLRVYKKWADKGWDIFHVFDNDDDVYVLLTK